MTAREYLKTLRGILRRHDRDLGLRPPAKVTAVAAVEKLCGGKLPAELRAAWRAGDGSRECVFARPGFLAGHILLSTAAAKRERAAMKRRAPQYAGYAEDKPRDAKVAAGWYHDGWLPFASGADGALLLLVDLAPTNKGKVGQVIAFSHDPDRISFVAPTFEQFLDGSLATFDTSAEDLLGMY